MPTTFAWTYPSRNAPEARYTPSMQKSATALSKLLVYEMYGLPDQGIGIAEAML